MAPFFAQSLFSMVVHAADSAAARGWGSQINWQRLKEGQLKAAHERKPLMVIVHKNNCPTCHSFKVQFARAVRIQAISKYFVMVNLDSSEGEVPETPDFAPDGNYVPRVMFYSPEGRLIPDAYCLENSYYKFTYQSGSSLLMTMALVLQRYSPNAPSADGDDWDW